MPSPGKKRKRPAKKKAAANRSEETAPDDAASAAKPADDETAAGDDTTAGLRKERMFEHGNFDTVRPSRLSLDHQTPAAGFQAKTVIEGEAPSLEPPPPPKPVPLVTPLVAKVTAARRALDRRVANAFPNTPKYLVGAITLVTVVVVAITVAGAGKLLYDRYFAPPVVQAPPDEVPALPLPPNALTMDAELGAYAVVEAFLEADGIEAKLPFIRHPEKSRPAMEKWYADPRNAALTNARKAGPVILRKRLPLEDKDVIALAVDVYPEAVTRFFLVERVAPDVFKLDWESTLGYQPVRLEDFKEQRPTAPTPFRVTARRSDYFNFGFDEDRYECFRLDYPGDPDFLLYGYIDRNTALSREISQYLPTAIPNTASLIVNLAYPEDAPSDDQVIITEIILPHWLED